MRGGARSWWVLLLVVGISGCSAERGASPADSSQASDAWPPTTDDHSLTVRWVYGSAPTTDASLTRPYVAFEADGSTSDLLETKVLAAGGLPFPGSAEFSYYVLEVVPGFKVDLPQFIVEPGLGAEGTQRLSEFVAQWDRNGTVCARYWEGERWSECQGGSSR